jgi:hypothetical protein
MTDDHREANDTRGLSEVLAVFSEIARNAPAVGEFAAVPAAAAAPRQHVKVKDPFLQLPADPQPGGPG